MDVTLHKRCAKFVYVIPEGLRELMSDISREVIRTQPERIYTFIADYLDALMITRENARVAARLVDAIVRIGTTTVELLQTTGLTKEEANRMAIIIQHAFKQYMTCRRQAQTYQEEIEDEEQDIITNILDQYGDVVQNEQGAAEIIQRAFRDFKNRENTERHLLTGMIDWRIAARSAIYLYRKTGVTHEEANRAATLIKAAYKGYYTRRVMKRLLQEGRRLYEEEEELGQDETDMLEGQSEYGDSGPSSDTTEAGTQSDSDMTSTEVATSVLTSVLKVIPSDSEADTTTNADLAAEQTDDGYGGGYEAEVMDYMDGFPNAEEEELGTPVRSSRTGFKMVSTSDGPTSSSKLASTRASKLIEGQPSGSGMIARASKVSTGKVSARTSKVSEGKLLARSSKVSEGKISARSSKVSEGKLLARSSKVSEGKISARSSKVSEGKLLARSSKVSEGKISARSSKVSEGKLLARSSKVSEGKISARSSKVSEGKISARSSKVSGTGSVASTSLSQSQATEAAREEVPSSSTGDVNPQVTSGENTDAQYSETVSEADMTTMTEVTDEAE